ncbi:MAG: 3-keto-5-aminohexanoate cleavage protein [Paracoccaceae bacterium]
MQQADHPAFSVTLPETVNATVACATAGADGLHLHIRDDDGRPLLDAGVYRAALADLSGLLPGFPVQVTTEAVGIHDHFIASKRIGSPQPEPVLYRPPKTSRRPA